MNSRFWLPLGASATVAISVVSFAGCGGSDATTANPSIPTDAGGATQGTGGSSNGGTSNGGKAGTSSGGKGGSVSAGGASGKGGTSAGAGGSGGSGKGGSGTTGGSGGTPAAGGHGGSTGPGAGGTNSAGGVTGMGGSTGGTSVGTGGAPAGAGGDSSAGGDAAGPGGAGGDPTGAGGDPTGAGGDPTGAGGDPTGAGGAAGDPLGGGGSGGGVTNAVQTVFLIMMENHSATSVYKSNSAQYINKTLFPIAARVTAYKTTIHPSEPNYIWLEAGDNLGITNDNDPAPNNELTHDHLTAQLDAKGLAWKSYVEGIDGTSCPLTSNKLYAVKHVPQLFFSDTSEGFSASSANCKSHVRPFAELSTDLAAGTQARYNFIVPDLCDDMHGDISCGLQNFDEVKAGDDWLKANLPTIAGSSAFTNGGLILIVWDEGDEAFPGATGSDGPLPLLALGSMVKSNYAGSVAYTHSSTLKTVETIFGLPFLGGAADAGTSDLSDLFTQFP